MVRLWIWIVVFWVICIGLLYAVPSYFFDIIGTPRFGEATGYGVASAVLFALALITLIRFPFKGHLPAFIAGNTAITALLVIAGHILFTFNNTMGIAIFALSVFHGFLVIRLGSTYGEEISTTKESANIHLSQATEFLMVYIAAMIKLLPDQGLRDILLFLLRLWHDAMPLVEQIGRDLSHLLERVIG